MRNIFSHRELSLYTLLYYIQCVYLYVFPSVTSFCHLRRRYPSLSVAFRRYYWDWTYLICIDFTIDQSAQDEKLDSWPRASALFPPISKIAQDSYRASWKFTFMCRAVRWSAVVASVTNPFVRILFWNGRCKVTKRWHLWWVLDHTVLVYEFNSMCLALKAFQGVLF